MKPEHMWGRRDHAYKLCWRGGPEEISVSSVSSGDVVAADRVVGNGACRACACQWLTGAGGYRLSAVEELDRSCWLQAAEAAWRGGDGGGVGRARAHAQRLRHVERGRGRIAADHEAHARTRGTRHIGARGGGEDRHKLRGRSDEPGLTRHDHALASRLTGSFAHSAIVLVPFRNVTAPEGAAALSLEVTAAINVTASLVTGAAGDANSVVWVSVVPGDDCGAGLITAVGADLAGLLAPDALCAVSWTTIA